MAKRLFSDVLSFIRPSSDEMREELSFAQMLLGHIRQHTPKGCEGVLSGSVAKQTFLRNKRDLDIFVLFGLSFPKEQLEPAIKSIMESAFPSLGYQLSYAEHPYVRFHYNGRRVDLVPAYKISDAAERLSAVDRSVLHTAFVLDSLREDQRDDVLLLKQFLAANSLYGAEIKTQGFSGYLCELLIIRYGGFQELAKAAAGWKQPMFIDIKKYYKKKENAIERFGYFTVIDPTDRNRNVAAAVSFSSFRRFIALCRSFIKKPSSSFFLREPETFDKKVIKAAKRQDVLLVSMPRPDVVDDVLWGQLRRLMKQLEAHLKEHKPKRVFADDSRHIIRIALVLGEYELPPTKLISGPPLSMKKHAVDFRKAHKGARFTKKKGRLYAEKKRDVRNAGLAIKRFFKDFQSAKSHLAYPEEMVVLERIHSG